MSEVRSLEWIERNACAAVESLNAGGPKPANPFDAESEKDKYKAWTQAFYKAGLALEQAELAAV